MLRHLRGTWMQLNLRLAPTPDAPRVARSEVAARRDELGPHFEAVTFVISELVTNSVRHADGTDEIRVSVAMARARIRIEVADDGPCFDPSGPGPMGAGLRLVELISDDWGVTRNDRCTVWVEFAAPG